MKYSINKLFWVLWFISIGLPTTWLTAQENQSNTFNLYERIKDEPEGREEYERMMLVNPATGEIPANIREKELLFMQQNVGAADDSYLKNQITGNLPPGTPVWRRRGPYNVGGRTRGLALDMDNENIILAGGVSGGMWRSTDAGKTWTKTTGASDMHNVTALVQDPRPGFRNVWYHGTGEGTGNSAAGGSAPFRGQGIYKSTDGGNTWALLGSTAGDPGFFGSTDFQFCWNLAVNPVNGDLYAATYAGIMRSTNGGVSWLKVVTAVVDGTQILATDVACTSTGVLYATIQSSSNLNRGIHRSTDGITWTSLTPDATAAFADPILAYSRVCIGIAPSNENLVYFFLAMTGGTGNTNGFGLLLYTYTPGQGSGNGTTGNGGAWVNRSANLPTYGGAVGNMNQAVYNQYVKVKPDNPNVIFLGTTNLNRSIDGFTTPINNTTDPSRFHWIGGYASVNNVSTYANHHPDNHALIFYPSNPNKMLSGHDGGLSITENNLANPVVWTDINNGYFTTQAYSVAIDEGTAGDTRMMAGFQDNGKWTTISDGTESTWIEEFGGGDGCYTAIVSGQDIRYTSTQFGRILRFEGSDPRNFTKADGIQPLDAANQLFVHPWMLDPANQNIMYYPGSINTTTRMGIWRNTNLSGINSGYTFGGTRTGWEFLPSTTIPANLPAAPITALAKVATSNVLYFGTNNGQIYRVNDITTDPNPNSMITSLVSSGKGLPGGYVSCIAIDPTSPGNVFVVFSNYEIISIYHSINSGSSWTPIAGNLEQGGNGSGNGPSVRWITVHAPLGGRKGYFVGTSTGLYYTEALNGMNTVWTQQAAAEIGNNVVTMIRSRRSDGLVAVATHATGLYSAYYGFADQPPFATRQLQPVTAYKNDQPIRINIAGLFDDPDNDQNAITVTIENNSNATLVTPTISNNTLTLALANNQIGQSTLLIRGTSNGKTVDERLVLNVLDIPTNVVFNQMSLPPSGNAGVVGVYADNSFFAADDFTVPSGQNWSVTGVFFNGVITTPVLTSVDVFFYNDNAGAVGSLVTTQNIAPGVNIVGITSSNPSATITLNTPVNLAAGKYWVRISPNFSNTISEGVWGWVNNTATTGNLMYVSPSNGTPVNTNRESMFNILGTASGTLAAAAPTVLTASLRTPTQVVLNWTDNSGNIEFGFYIERSTTSGTGFTRVGTVPTNTTTWTDNSGLTLGTTYFYRVQAFEAAGATAYTNEVSITPANPPAAPSGLTVLSISMGGGVALSWTDNASNETGYQILRSTVAGSGYAIVGTVAANTTTFTDNSSGLIGGIDYFYVVRAVSQQVNSPNSNQVAVLFPSIFATPTNLSATAISSIQINLSWNDNSNNETGFSIERSLQQDRGFTTIALTPANTTNFVNNQGLLSATNYFYRIRAVGSTGFSALSNTTNAATTPTVTNLNELYSLESAMVYPNPTRDYFRIEIKTQQPREVTVTLLNLKGATLANRILGFDGSQLTTAFSVEALPAGIYLLKITDGVQSTEKKIMVE